MVRRTPPDIWRDDAVTSADGTEISFLSAGRGEGLVVIPGNNRRARHYRALAEELSNRYTVHVIDRRGRGLSGPQGPGYSVDREVDDALAILEHTGAELVFGHSYGGLIALHLALRRSLGALILYEPGVSLHGSFDGSWLPEYSELLDQGKHNAAMAVFLKQIGLVPFPDAPLPVFRVLAHLALHGSEGYETLAMMPTIAPEMAEIGRLDSDGRKYAEIGSPTLLLSGSKSPDYLVIAAAELARIIPGAGYAQLPDLDHNAPDLNAPEVIADQIRGFMPVGDLRR
jgi:pimeloyl-ACP methyl ester carboxylesterase